MTRRRRLWLLATLAVLLIAALAWAFCPTWSVPAKIGRDTTRIFGPIGADGAVDYVAALNDLNSAGVTIDNNAAAVLAALVADNIPAPIRGETTRRLGIGTQAISLPWVEILGFYEARAATNPAWASTQPDDAIDEDRRIHLDPVRPWRSADAPRLAAWLAANAGALDRAAEAVRRPRFYVPLVRETPGQLLMEVSRWELGASRMIMFAWADRALLRLGEGDLDGALRDAESIYRLSELIVQDRQTISMLVGISIAINAEEIFSVATTRPGFDAARARQMTAVLRGLPNTPSLAEIVDTGERFVFLDAMERAPTSSVVNRRSARGAPLDVGDALRRVNEVLDREVSAAREPDPRSRLTAGEDVKRFVQESFDQAASNPGRFLRTWAGGPIGRRGVATELVVYTFLAAAVPGHVSAMRTAARHAVDHQVVLTALALVQYLEANREYPERLDELVPAYLPAVPLDLRGQPLEYTHTADGYWLTNGDPDAVKYALSVHAGSAATQPGD